MSALLDALMTVGAALDTPGAILRNSLAGQNPFQGLFNPEERTTGRGLLEQWGILDENTPGLDAGDVAGFGVDVALDPLNILGLGLAGKTARAASKIEAANKASEAMRAAGAMPEEIAVLTKAVDESGNPARLFHGTTASFDNYDASKLDPEALFGRGVYTTENPAIARTYGPHLREHFMDARNPFMADEAVSLDDLGNLNLTPEDYAKMSDSAATRTRNAYNEALNRSREEHLDQILRDMQKGKSKAREMGIEHKFLKRLSDPEVNARLQPEMGAAKELAKTKALRELGAMPNPEITGHDLYKIVGEGENHVLKALGYDSVFHEGGHILGTTPHNVRIAFDPSRIYAPEIAPALQDVPGVSPLLAAILGQNILQTAGGF